MKLKSTPMVVALTIALGMLLYSPASRASDDLRKEDNKEKKKVSSSRNNSSVKIYPDMIKRVMHVVAKENEGKDIDFFVFDLQGELIQHYKMKAGDHERITGLERGKYVFHVFCGDEETANGKFEIR